MTAGRGPLRVAVDVADRALRADTADACEDAGMTVVDAAAATADVIVLDRPVATAVPAVVVAAAAWRQSPRSWPASVCAVVPAGTDADTLAAVIRCAAAGYAVTPRQAGDDDPAGDDGDDDADWVAAGAARTLSPRERDVLALLAAGASNKEIALALAVSVSTVKFHVAAIVHRLGARSRVDAVAIAVRAGMVMV